MKATGMGKQIYGSGGKTTILVPEGETFKIPGDVKMEI